MLVERIFDVMAIVPRLNEMAKEFEAEGYRVQRGAYGIVILELSDGVITYLPSGKGIVRQTLTRQEAKARGYQFRSENAAQSSKA